VSRIGLCVWLWLIAFDCARRSLLLHPSAVLLVGRPLCPDGRLRSLLPHDASSLQIIE